MKTVQSVVYPSVCLISKMLKRCGCGRQGFHLQPPATRYSVVKLRMMDSFSIAHNHTISALFLL